MRLIHGYPHLQKVRIQICKIFIQAYTYTDSNKNFKKVADMDRDTDNEDRNTDIRIWMNNFLGMDIRI